jgi:predicted GNAT family acetyltransferase
MSYYADYVHERTNDSVLETEKGFATYRFLDQKTVYIVDIFVAPKHRKQHAASDLADDVVKIAKDRGCTKLLGSVVPSTKGSTRSLCVLLGYGMTLDSSTNDLILFSKEI